MTERQPVNIGATHTVGSPILAVDLDETLVTTDTLWESLLLLIRKRPALALTTPFWLASGRAQFKRRLAEAAPLDPAILPYNSELVALLRVEREAGREVVLATASDGRIARAVADHLGIFDALLASDGSTNLSGIRKREELQRYSGARGFDYVGDSPADTPIWREARRALVVGASSRLVRKLRRDGIEVRVLGHRLPVWRTWLRALRAQHWVKNLLLFVPLAAAHEVSAPLTMRLVWAFLAFSICASGGYVVNDLLDLESDRAHPTKQRRPFAAGDLPIQQALGAIPVLFAIAFAVAFLLLPLPFAGTLAVYSVFTLYYSIRLKAVAIVDVLVLSGLYTLRLLSGALAVAVPVSEWLLALSMFLFLSLAFMKRYSEIAILRESNIERARGRDYTGSDLELVRTVGPVSGYLAVLVFALYLNSDKVVTLYRTPAILWLAVPLLLYWVTRMWFAASRNRMHHDPIVFALKDRTSYIVAGAIVLVVLLAV